ncbi:MAG: GIY-YIG nuclease family protein [Eubacteriales bacterium]|nr:GIY-YIG nuclease family protein [Eubacteriales bacterium]
MFYAYILRCCDGSLYCGYTNNLHHRLQAHNSGTGSKYTRSRLPVELMYYETFPTKNEAMSREWHLKQLSHSQKLSLFESTRKETSNNN